MNVGIQMDFLASLLRRTSLKRNRCADGLAKIVQS